MIVCHCNVLTKAMINQAITSLLERDAFALITPGRVYAELGRRGKCGGCFPQVVGLIVQRLEEFQTEHPSVLLERSLAGAATASLRATGARLALKHD